MRIGNIEIILSGFPQNWHKYLIPKRLTLKHNYPIYRWLFWHITIKDYGEWERQNSI